MATLTRPEAAALNNTINPALVLAHARAWIGTPFMPRASLRGVGADCVGLLRGIYHELTGVDVTPPAWREDWAAGASEPILAALRAHVLPVPVAEAQPGHVITYRVGTKRAAHVAILAEGGAIHSWEVGGVKETTPLYGREITSAWTLPCAPGCTRGRLDITADDCLAIIYSEGPGCIVEITDMMNGEALARGPYYKNPSAAISALAPIYNNIESVE
ncbi:hypothetical protein [Roseobacter litoralis]|uniref:hypothetical protein n=1 Tax=Roseobacter litoralis TaxID=42443 RepID=UPI0024944DC3|nr:hypothetical protein [Roseobacter litoralis]